MPTTRKRHAVTETAPVERALEPLRSRGLHPDMAELVVLGAQAKLALLNTADQAAEHRLQLRQQFLERTRKVKGIDLDAALEVRNSGWTHE